MAFAEDEALLSEYAQWAAAKKVAGVDTTPTAFLVDRAKEGAFVKIVAVEKYVNEELEDFPDAEAASMLNSIKKILEN